MSTTLADPAPGVPPARLGPLGRLGRLWRTLRWLKPTQVLGRARMLLRQHLTRPQPDLSPAPPLRPAAGPWVLPPRREASLLGPTRLCFLNETHDLAEVGWDAAEVALLWRYNQHYFDDLNAAGAAARREDQAALLRRWCAENAPLGGTAWAPYPTSLRIVNWIKWFQAGQQPEAPWLHSLAVQARWLTRRLEWHLLGNHLFANAKALVFAGLFFEGPEAERWLHTGAGILERELGEQILADGGQFERSPMYHALALEDGLDLLNLLRSRAAASAAARHLEDGLAQRCAPMLRWLRCMVHGGDALARFNDSAPGIAPSVAEIERYAAALGIRAAAPEAHGITRLEPSGYLRAARGEAVALLDLAPIGPDYLPGHAHADTLSFELTLGGREIIVNRGTSVYGQDARRQLERSTAAHSTVQLRGLDSSEVWAGFRAGRRARPGPVQVREWTVEASHDGYAHLPGQPQHHRRWQFENAALTVEDRIDIQGPHAPGPAIARYHLAPGLRLEPEAGSGSGSGTGWRVLEGSATLARATVLSGQASLEPWQHAQRFGVLVDASTLAVRLDAGRAAVRWSWNAGPPGSA